MLKLYDLPVLRQRLQMPAASPPARHPFERVELDILKGETRTPEFLAKNPNGRIPALELEDGTVLAEIGRDPVLPRRGHAVPGRRAGWAGAGAAVAVLRAVQPRAVHRRGPLHPPLPARGHPRRAELPRLEKGGHAALGVMEQRLAAHPFLVADRYTIADIALYAYTHVATRAGSTSRAYPGVVPGCRSDQRGGRAGSRMARHGSRLPAAVASGGATAQGPSRGLASSLNPRLIDRALSLRPQRSCKVGDSPPDTGGPAPTSGSTPMRSFPVVGTRLTEADSRCHDAAKFLSTWIASSSGLLRCRCWRAAVAARCRWPVVACWFFVIFSALTHRPAWRTRRSGDRRSIDIAASRRRKGAVLVRTADHARFARSCFELPVAGAPKPEADSRRAPLVAGSERPGSARRLLAVPTQASGDGCRRR